MLIELDRIGKVYHTDEVETHALSDVSATIERGEYVAVEGPSGCGKSTLLSIVGLLDTPSSGSYRLLGREAARLEAGERSRLRNREIGFIFQNFNLIGDLTVYENVELPLTYRGLSSGERRRRVAEALERVAMSHRARHYPAQLSGGQQQRVAVARALGGEPAVLLADEPTGNLDVGTAGVVFDALLATVREQNVAALIATHNPDLAARMDRTVTLRDGRLVQRA